MPANPRVRADNVQGTITDNPLTNVATTMNSAGLANLPAISSQHAVLVLDPLRSAGAPEIVIVTAHTGAATSATITRGAYGTTARQHASGTLWVHAPTVEDFIRIVAASSDITDPYRGQLAYDRVLDKFIARNQSDAWQDVVALGAWQTYTPTLTATTTNPTLGTGAIQTGRYTRMGRTIMGRVFIQFGSGGGAAAGSGNYIVSLPVAARSSAADTIQTIGGGAVFDNDVSAYYLIEVHTPTAGGTTTNLAVETATLVTNSSPFTWAASDFISFDFMYEAAA